MPVYEKKLKRGKDGSITRYVGKNARGIPEKFRLGYDLEAAERRLKLIVALWQEIETCYTPKLAAWDWHKASLKAAKAIAKGKAPTLPNRDHEDPVRYVQRLANINSETGAEFEPTDRTYYQMGLDQLRSEISDVRRQLSTALDVPNATGVTVEEAIEAYAAQVEKDYTLPSGVLRPWGKTKLDQLKSIRNYLSDERFGKRDFLALDLADLSYTRGDEMYKVFRKRPPTLRSKLRKRMKFTSSKNYIKELGKFFDWLDGSDELEWTFPRRFHTISKTPEKLTPEEKYQARLAKQNSIVPDDHLKTLFEYSLPNERLLLLLGLNCAFGAAEIGQLRNGFVTLDRCIIEGIRFKSGNETKHKLWQQTKAGLAWFLRRRATVSAARPEYRDIVFLNQKGRPVWHHTGKGNASNGVSRIWDRLVRRVRKDDKAFPKYSFNKLRKTSATRILLIANAEIASMILAHKTISDDELLHHYALLPWEKLFDAQQHLEHELSFVLNAGGSDPWEEKPKTYIGLAKTKKIIELSEGGLSPPKIAIQLEINVATVYRHLQSKFGKRKRGKTESQVEAEWNLREGGDFAVPAATPCREIEGRPSGIPLTQVLRYNVTIVGVV